MRVHYASLLAMAGLLAYSVPAHADFMAAATINGSQESTPGDTSTATGTLTLDYIAASQQLDYTLSFSGLTYPATMAHIHLGTPGVSGATLFTFFDYGMPNPSPSVTSQTVSGVLTSYDFEPDTYDGVNTFAQAISDIENGDTYVNIHSASPEGTYPDYQLGEIRGQIIDPTAPATAPEPASIGLVSASLALVASRLFRKRRQA